MNNNTGLKERSKEYEEELNEQIEELSNKVKSVGKKALVIAGGAFVAYQLFKLASGTKKRKRKVYERVSDSSSSESNEIIIQERKASHPFLDELKAEITTILIDIAKSKIYELIDNLNKEETEHEHKHTGEA